MSSVASALLSFMEAADFMNWTKNKGGWDKIKVCWKIFEVRVGLRWGVARCWFYDDVVRLD